MRGGGSGGPQVALIRVTGVISGGATGGGLLQAGGTGAETLIKQLTDAFRDPDVKAIVLRINSPGGSAAGSQEVYNEIVRLRRESHKPIIASMADVAASGGYYIAAGCDRIFANPSAMTGSIGVIMEFPEAAGLFKKLGVDLKVVKSGRYKDMGNFARAMTPEERALMQAMVMDVYDQFVTAVATGRHLPRAAVLKVADGRVLTGRQAKAVGLVDELGGLREAALYAGKRAGIKGEPRLKEVERKGFLSQMMSASDSDAALPNPALTGLSRLLAEPRGLATLLERLAAPKTLLSR